MIFFTVFLFLIVNCYALFYDEYTIVSRSIANSQIFGYSKDKTCTVTERRGHFYVTIQNFETFEKTSSVKLLPPLCHIEACFEYDGIGYILTKKNNKTKIMNEYKSVVVDINYDLARYDYMRDNVWLLRNRTIEVHNFKNIWNNNLKPFKTITLNSTCNDIIVVNNRLFCNFDYIIYVLENLHLQFYSHTNSNIFSYVLFPPKAYPYVFEKFIILPIFILVIFYCIVKYIMHIL